VGVSSRESSCLSVNYVKERQASICTKVFVRIADVKKIKGIEEYAIITNFVYLYDHRSLLGSLLIRIFAKGSKNNEIR